MLISQLKKETTKMSTPEIELENALLDQAISNREHAEKVVAKAKNVAIYALENDNLGKLAHASEDWHTYRILLGQAISVVEELEEKLANLQREVEEFRNSEATNQADSQVEES